MSSERESVTSIRDVVLAVDVGSTWCKAAYLDPNGQTIATGRAYTRDIPMQREATLARFWQAFQDAVGAANAGLSDRARPAAIGISSRALFGVCLDRAGSGFLPTWDVALDWRSSPDLRQATSPEVWGTKHPTAYGYAIGQTGLMLWLKRERPNEWRNIWRVGSLHDYFSKHQNEPSVMAELVRQREGISTKLRYLSVATWVEANHLFAVDRVIS